MKASDPRAPTKVELALMGSHDTSPAARDRQIEAFRRMTPGQRLQAAAEMTEEVRAIAVAGIRHRHPAYTEAEVQAALAQLFLGRSPGSARRVSGAARRRMTLQDLIREVVGQLEAAGIPYMVTGSVASSYHGEPRATRDLDVVIDPDPPSLVDLVQRLARGGKYVDLGAATEALRARTQFNVIDPATGWKVDFVIRRDRPFSRAEFARRMRGDLLGSQAWRQAPRT